MGRRDWIVLAIAAVVALLVLATLFPATATSALSVFLPAREGRILVQPENQPIAGATVKARCQVLDPSAMLSIHGSGTRDAPDVFTTSDERGRYSFDARTLSECWVVFVSAEKPGYRTWSEVVWPSLLNTAPRHAPGRNGSDVWMVPLEPELDGYLRILVIRSEPPPGETVEAQFHHVFSALSCAMRNAETPRQRAFVRDNVCERARALVKRLPATERGAAGANGDMTDDCGKERRLLEREPITAEAVETYCRAP